MTMADPNKEETFKVCVIRSEVSEARYPREAILREAEQFGFSENDIFALQLTLEEAISNAIKHGNQSDAEKTVTVRYAVDAKKVVVIVADEGAGFIPDNLPDCTSPDRLSVPNGRGVMLMRAYMDEVCYRNNGREVYFAKYRSGAPGSAEGPNDGSGCGCGTHHTAAAVPAPMRRTVVYSGRVQGVGFRAAAVSVAAGHSVTGYVKNLPDGRVELVAEGAPEEVERFLSALALRMKTNIRNAVVRDEPARGGWIAFHVA